VGVNYLIITKPSFFKRNISWKKKFQGALLVKLINKALFSRVLKTSVSR